MLRRRPTDLWVRRHTEPLDFFAAWKAADLERDWWSIVGPATQAEYEQLAQGKLDALLSIGLKPDSRILDVGCGTGMMPLALKGYLDGAGRYVGTDIAPEAIAFCQRRYPHQTFLLQSDTTHLPLNGETFDFIAFWSVFTHTWLDETVALLREAMRLLAPHGIIVADVFTSTVSERAVERTRIMVEYNRTFFMGVLCGLDLQVDRILMERVQVPDDPPIHRIQMALKVRAGEVHTRPSRDDD
jgi:SAM-dependent methyltransferase